MLFMTSLLWCPHSTTIRSRIFLLYPAAYIIFSINRYAVKKSSFGLISYFPYKTFACSFPSPFGLLYYLLFIFRGAVLRGLQESHEWRDYGVRGRPSAPPAMFCRWCCTLANHAHPPRLSRLHQAIPNGNACLNNASMYQNKKTESRRCWQHRFDSVLIVHKIH